MCFNDALLNLLLRHLSLHRDRGVQHSVKELSLRHFHGFLYKLNGGNSALRHNRQINDPVTALHLWSFDSLQHLLYHRRLPLRHHRHINGHVNVHHLWNFHSLLSPRAFSVGDADVVTGLALCISSGTFCKESAVVVLLLEVERLRLSCASRRDEVLVHQREDAGIDSLEFSLQHDAVLPRVNGLLFVGIGPLLLFHAGDDPPYCTSTADGVLVGGRQQIPLLGRMVRDALSVIGAQRPSVACKHAAPLPCWKCTANVMVKWVHTCVLVFYSSGLEPLRVRGRDDQVFTTSLCQVLKIGVRWRG